MSPTFIGFGIGLVVGIIIGMSIEIVKKEDEEFEKFKDSLKGPQMKL